MTQEEQWARLVAVVPDVSRETFDALRHFEALFRRWNASINLASGKTLDQFWLRHVVDSAQIVPLQLNSADWLDLGSGGGLPGVVLAILMRDRHDSRITLVESNAKKASFLRTAIRETDARGAVLCSRIEDIRPVAKPGVVTARALASLNGLFGLTERWLSDGSIGLFHKGRDYQREIAETRDGWHYTLLEHRSVVDPESVILEIRDLRRT